jgi:CRP-like cAMP-binding protein
MDAPRIEHIRDLLKSGTFLGRLPEIVFDALVTRGIVKGHPKGDFLYRRGAPGDSLFVVVSGRVKLTNVSAEGKEIVLQFLGVGDIFGDVAALDGAARAADAQALEDCEVFVLHSRDLIPTLLGYPDAMLEIIRELCRKLRTGAAFIEDSTLRMRGRMANGLLRLARELGKVGDDGICLELTMSQEVLGSHCGLSRANVSRELGQLKLAGAIKVDGSRIMIVNPAALAEIGAESTAKRAD